MKSKHTHPLSVAGLLVTLGIIYGDIGTSPLYVMKAILGGATYITENFILGGLSCIFWTLTLQTTVKYIIITIRADNHGEGGIFSLFALIRKKAKWAYLLAIIGGSTLLADGVITPSITIVSAVEGLLTINPRFPVIPVVVIIITCLFVLQQFGTKAVGHLFGPVMLVWFSMMAVLGALQLSHHPTVLKAIDPFYAYQFLTHYPHGFVLLGAVFLCTTGAEALYSDLGHCGLKNIRATWGFVKISLLLNYFGQGAWILRNTDLINEWTNPFFAIMPHGFLWAGIAISTAAAIIASQALISGSYTLISEAISLNFWPRIKINYPTNIKGQLYISSINWMLFVACLGVVLFFKRSSNMEAAYGLSITITMLMTTGLLSVYMYYKKVPVYLIAIFLAAYATIELSFLVANLNKFLHGGWFTILLGGFLFTVMYIWYHGRKIKNSFIEFVKVEKYYELLKEISQDESIAKYASNLVFLTKANKVSDIESKIIYSIINKHPKRADVYWLLHVDILDNPHVLEYKIVHLIPGTLIKVDFKIGFKVQPRVNLFFRQVLVELSQKKEIDLTSRYDSLRKYNVQSDFRFIVIDRIQNYDFDFPPKEQFIMDIYSRIKNFGISDVNALGLDTSNVTIEMVPLTADKDIPTHLVRNDLTQHYG
ncbi:MAG TPA: KUP/HAK/KT family potassium transporter [Bacteroidales bacterium]|nr:KUP/HAK/KT family potassium transporter [Bacteroidales bacterium]HPT08920.1 KUP/HAK/KT family potassium transporter [Bacteroidales bacterium]